MLYCFYEISDLHLERVHDIFPIIYQLTSKLNTSNYNTLLLCGDICSVLHRDTGTVHNNFKKFLSIIKKHYNCVIYISGNHEYDNALKYNKRIEEIDDIIKKYCDSINVVFLQRSKYTHKSGLVFIGCTLWSNFDEYTAKRTSGYKNFFMDYKAIITIHQNDIDFLSKTIEPNCIVMTHYLPSFNAIHSTYSPRKHKYGHLASNLEYLLTPNINCWFFGHTHEFVHSQINGCRIFCNPLGYPKENKQTYHTTDCIFNYSI